MSTQLQPHHVTIQLSLPTLRQAIAQKPPAHDLSWTGGTGFTVLVKPCTLQPSKTVHGYSTVGNVIVPQLIHMARLALLDIDVKER